MRFKIESPLKLGIFIFTFFLVLYLFFKIFHYYYKGNYCDFLSTTVIENSIEEVESMKNCVNTLICEIGSIEKIIVFNESNDTGEIKKHFICMRKYKAGVWN